MSGNDTAIELSQLASAEPAERDDEVPASEPAAAGVAVDAVPLLGAGDGGMVGDARGAQRRMPILRRRDEGRYWLRLGGSERRRGMWKKIAPFFCLGFAVSCLLGAWYRFMLNHEDTLIYALVIMGLVALVAGAVALRRLLLYPISLLVVAQPALFVVEYALSLRNEFYAINDVSAVFLTWQPAVYELTDLVVNIEVQGRRRGLCRAAIARMEGEPTGDSVAQLSVVQQFVQVFNAGGPVVRQSLERILAASDLGLPQSQQQ